MALQPRLVSSDDILHAPVVTRTEGPRIAGPFYFAWVDSTETTFGPEHLVMDEYIFSIKRTLSEGQKPMLELEIENPAVGLLSPGRKAWAWLAWDDGGGAVPLFFGRIVGNPVQLFANVITIQLVADPPDYKHRVQTLAEGMKVLPWWDPVFIEVGKRDDPDKILEARAAFWDVHPTTHEVISCAINEAPDGNIDLDADEHFFDGVNTTVGQPPAVAILMDATVPWTQTARGIVDVGSHNFETYSGSIMGEWPKPLAQLGAGWSVYTSDIYDANRADQSVTVSLSYSWQNRERRHTTGDTMSVNYSQTVPIGPVGLSVTLTRSEQVGFIDRFAVDEDGDPSPLNIPAVLTETTAHAMLYNPVTSLILEYRAERPRTERVIFTIKADMQPTVLDAGVDQESEVITLNGTDVGVPILLVLNWTAVQGTAVSVGQVIFPDDAQVPGGRTAQICTVSGTAGTTPPNFSDIPGNTTVDGTVTWASLGATQPPDNATDWTYGTPINPGTIIMPRRPFFAQYTTLVAPGKRQFPLRGTAISEGIVVQAGSTFQVCTVAGTTNPNITPFFSGTWNATATDGTVTWRSLGTTLPSGTAFFIAVQGSPGTTGGQYVVPPFGLHEALHDRVTDGTVTWQSIGSGSIPIGGVPGDVRSSTYFATARGRQSLEYLALLIRARLLWRARCVDVEFETDWETGKVITTRNTVTLHDPRLPGGVATGKVRTTVLSFGDSGAAVCHVTIACAVGNDNSVTGDIGTATYVDDGEYFDSGEVQAYLGATLVLPENDLTYTPPAYRVTDDGLVFPLTAGQVVAVDALRGSFSAQETAVLDALRSMKQAANISSGTTFSEQYAANRQKALLSANSVPAATEAHPVWIEYQFRPVNAGPFHSVYNVKFSDLMVPRDIDLEAT